ncbi:hypothetical protein BKA69DRAFT_785099 [Paraphysoderma sedebokerense]|nr:hypothetical protein BKA69DRAFT_785099 [Paraphysoderma sedebokerense]
MTFLDICSPDWNPSAAYDTLVEDPEAFVQLEEVFVNKRKDLEAAIDGSTVLQLYHDWVNQHRADLEQLKQLQDCAERRRKAEQKYSNWSTVKTFDDVYNAQADLMKHVFSKRLEGPPVNDEDIRKIRKRLCAEATSYAKVHYDEFEPYWAETVINALIDPNVENNERSLKYLIRMKSEEYQLSGNNHTLQHQCNMMSSNIRRLANCMSIPYDMTDSDQTILHKVKIQLSSKEVFQLQAKLQFSEKLASLVIFRACVEKVASYHRNPGDSTTKAWESAVDVDFRSYYQIPNTSNNTGKNTGKNSGKNAAKHNSKITSNTTQINNERRNQLKGLFGELSTDIHNPSNGKIEIKKAHLRGIHLGMFNEILKYLKTKGDLSWDIDFV